jgi:hypothetical protein
VAITAAVHGMQQIQNVLLKQQQQQTAQIIKNNQVVMLLQDVHGLMLVLVLLSQNAQITQLQQPPMLLNAILKIQHVFQEQLQQQQFHAQQEQLNVQMSLTKQFVHH